MAATKFSADDPRESGKFDVIGTSVKPDRVDHVGLLNASSSIRYGESVSVFDMSPPLRAGQLDPKTDSPAHGVIEAHAVGWIDDLTVEESRNLQTWIEDVRTRVPPGLWGYTIHPPSDYIIDRPTGRVSGRKFSCAGFALCCYEESLGIQLLDGNPEHLPLVDMEDLELIYENDVIDLFRRIGSKLGIIGDGPWPIVLCGYILHALDRDSRAIRSTPHRVSDPREALFP